jgi:hypothetical protein
MAGGKWQRRRMRGGEVYLHDVVGWRRERVPQLPSGPPVQTRSDWTCELLSPSNAKRDPVDKFQVLHANQVSHYWIADPVEKTLIVQRWEPRDYLMVLTAGLGDAVRAEPFESTELRVRSCSPSKTKRNSPESRPRPSMPPRRHSHSLHFVERGYVPMKSRGRRRLACSCPGSALNQQTERG